MEQLQVVAIIATAIATIITSLVSLVRPNNGNSPAGGQQGPWNRWIYAIAAGAAAFVLSGVVFVALMLTHVGPFETRSIAITGGIGETSCLTELSGRARVPAGEDAWIFLQTEEGFYYVQGSGARPVVSGKADQDWKLPGVIVSDKFYENAPYGVIGIIIPFAESAVLQQRLAPGEPLHPDQFPRDALATERQVIRLTSSTGCK